MTVKVIATGVVAYGTGTLTVARPATTPSFNDTEILVVGSKDAITPNTPTTPSGWTLIHTTYAGEGSTTVDNGPTRVSIYMRDAAGGDTGSVTVTIPSGATSWGQILVLRRNRGRLTYFINSGGVTLSATAFRRTYTFNSGSTDIASNSLALSAMSYGTDTPTISYPPAITSTNAELIWDGDTQVASQAATDIGSDMGGMVFYRNISKKPDTGNIPVLYGSETKSNTVSGPIVIVFFREEVLAPRTAWNFNEASGNATDYGAISRPITPLSGATRVAGKGAGANLALLGGGSTGTGATIIASAATSWSITARFQYDGGAGDRSVVTLFSGASTDRSGMYLNGNKIAFWTDTSGSGFKSVESNDALQNGTWYDVAAIYNGTVMRIWVNGVLQNESTAQTGGLAGAIDNVMVTDNAPTLKLDQARVYNYALTEEDVLLDAAVSPNTSLGTAQFPGVASTNGHYLLDRSGNPYLLVMDAGWDLFHVATAARRPAYLVNRAAQGFNASYVGIIRSDVVGSTPVGQTPAGNQPFAGASPSAWDLSAPNEAFWAEVDSALTSAETYGMTLVMQVFTTWDPSAYAVFTNSTNAQVRAFGTWLGNRYKNRPNIMWLLGGDWSYSGDSSTAVLRAEQLVLGIRDSGDTHHVGFHFVEESDGRIGQTTGGPGGSWTSNTVLEPYATWAPVYTYNPTYYRSRVAYARSPFDPAVFIEGNYEGSVRNSITTTAPVIRRQALWALTSGSMGHGYGHGRVYGMTGQTDAHGGWFANLITDATEQLRQVDAKWRAFPNWWLLVPDTTNTLLSAGRGTERTTYVSEHVTANDYASAAITPDKSLAVAYAPTARSMTFDLSKVGANAQIWRIDPTGALPDTTMNPPQTGGTYTVSTAFQPTRTDGSNDYIYKVLSDPVSSGTTTHQTVVGSSLVNVTRYIVVGSSLVQLT